MNELAISNKNSITVLGNQGLIIRNDDGFIKSIEHEVVLSYNKNHFWKCEVKKKNSTTNEYETGTSYKLTAEGYEELNKFAGLQVVPEPFFQLGDEKYTNPYIKLDEYGRKKSSYYKTTLCGYGPEGKIHFSTSLIHYSADDELIAAILSKIKWDKTGSKLGQMVPLSAFETYRKEHPYAIFIPTDNFGDEDWQKLGIAVNTDHQDFAKVRSVHQEAINNMERKIQTVAKRNAYRKHPATAVYTVNPTPVYDEKDKDLVLDAVVKVKVVQWVNMDSAKEKATIDEYMNASHDLEVDEYHNVDVEVDQETPDNDEEVVEVDILSEFNAETNTDDVVAHDDEKERTGLIIWINKAVERIGVEKISDKGIFIPEDMTGLPIVDLNAIADMLQEMEE